MTRAQEEARRIEIEADRVAHGLCPTCGSDQVNPHYGGCCGKVCKTAADKAAETLHG